VGGDPSRGPAALAWYRDEARPRLNRATSVDPTITLRAFVELYLEAHALNVEASTLSILSSRLRSARPSAWEAQGFDLATPMDKPNLDADGL
jgi:hypothetical protein